MRASLEDNGHADTATPSPLANPRDVHEWLDAPIDVVRCDLAPLSRAARPFAHFYRVHQALELQADMIPEFGVALRRACGSWRSPTGSGAGAELAELLNVAYHLCHRTTEETER